MDLKKVVLHPYFFLTFILLFVYKENIHQLGFTHILVPLILSLLVVRVLFYLVNKIIKDKLKTGLVASLFSLFFFNYGRLLDARDSPPHIDAWIWKSVILLITIIIPLVTILWYSSILDKKKDPKKFKKNFFLLIITCATVTGVVFNKKILSYLSFLHPLKALYFITDHQIVLLGIMAFFFLSLICWFKWKDKEDHFLFNYYANFFSLVLVVLVIGQIGLYFVSNEPASLQKDYMPLSFNSALVEGKKKQFLDVYYIILDAYASQKTLENAYGFDNSHFISELEKRGFYIAKDSKSNYLTTFISLTSSLNMDYIGFLKENPGEYSKDRTIPYHLMDYSNVAKFLKSLGYQYIHFSSGWAATEDNPFADKVYDVFKLNEFQFVFLRSTPLRLLMPNERATTINYEFEQLREIPSEKGPKFVFAHIEAPHPPFVFDKDGKVITNEMYDPSGQQWLNKAGYISQLQFVNTKTLEAVDAILEKSENPPIIIIHGDHGVDTVSGWTTHPTKERLEERSSILNAYYLPEGGNAELYPTISPVNTFRIVFNYYFNQNYELLDDKTYFSDFYNQPYGFVLAYENGTYVAPFPESSDAEPKQLLSQQPWWKSYE